jgi:hypothetical protein
MEIFNNPDRQEAIEIITLNGNYPKKCPVPVIFADFFIRQ